MTSAQCLSAVAALAVAAWPFLKFMPAVAASPDYRGAIANLASVRLRLLRTDCLGDDQKKAIDVLTLALVDGSDQ